MLQSNPLATNTSQGNPEFLAAQMHTWLFGQKFNENGKTECLQNESFWRHFLKGPLYVVNNVLKIVLDLILSSRSKENGFWNLEVQSGARLRKFNWHDTTFSRIISSSKLFWAILQTALKDSQIFAPATAKRDDPLSAQVSTAKSFVEDIPLVLSESAAAL